MEISEYWGDLVLFSLYHYKACRTVLNSLKFLDYVLCLNGIFTRMSQNCPSVGALRLNENILKCFIDKGISVFYFRTSDVKEQLS